MFILTPKTIWNPGVLETRSLPKRIFGRVHIRPRRGASFGFRLRLLFEVQIFRYLLALAPVIVAALIWQEHALAISQAPVLMFGLIFLVEGRVLRVPKARRAAVASLAEQERGLDVLRAQGRAILTKIAAGRGLTDGRLLLVVEQSDMLRLAPLTLVSVQSDDGPRVLTLSLEEEALIREGLFQPPLDERRLLRISVAQDEGLHNVELEAKAVSAHARLAALMG